MLETMPEKVRTCVRRQTHTHMHRLRQNKLGGLYVRREDYVVKLQTWFDALQTESMRPNEKQLLVLEAVRDRLLQEIELDVVGPSYVAGFIRSIL